MVLSMSLLCHFSLLFVEDLQQVGDISWEMALFDLTVFRLTKLLKYVTMSFISFRDVYIISSTLKFLLKSWLFLWVFKSSQNCSHSAPHVRTCILTSSIFLSQLQRAHCPFSSSSSLFASVISILPLRPFTHWSSIKKLHALIKTWCLVTFKNIYLTVTFKSILIAMN